MPFAGAADREAGRDLANCLCALEGGLAGRAAVAIGLVALALV
jgi:hypothetical protein